MEIPTEYQPVSSCCKETENGRVVRCQIRNDSQPHFCCRHSYLLPIILTTVLVLLVILYPLKPLKQRKLFQQTGQCEIQLVETIPSTLNYTSTTTQYLSTFDAWKWLLDNAESSVHITSGICRQSGNVNRSREDQNDLIFQRLLSNWLSVDKIRLRIVEHEFSKITNDFKHLRKFENAQFVSIKLPNNGMLYTKLWVVDKKHFYLGSADLNWSSNKTKELGVLAKNCPYMARDVNNIFESYWYLGSHPNAKVPKQWSDDYEPVYNMLNPMSVKLKKNYTIHTYFASSPLSLLARGRTHDLDAILKTIDNAVSFVNIAVTGYNQLAIYKKKIKYWPYIDNALRNAAVERKVSIKLLVSWWKQSDNIEDYFLSSLEELTKVVEGVDVQVRRFVMPEVANTESVNQNNYMVTESVAYVSTSNWSSDYITDAAGIGILINDTNGRSQENTIRTDLLSIFERDWRSPFALNLKKYEK